LKVEDLFVVKYESGLEGEGGGARQAGLGEHRDGSEVSFVVILSEPGDFSGGGTAFHSIEPALLVRPAERGSLVAFCGQNPHSGVAVETGRRCVLAGFVRVHDGGFAKDDASQLFCPCDGESCAVLRRTFGRGHWVSWEAEVNQRKSSAVV